MINKVNLNLNLSDGPIKGPRQAPARVSFGKGSDTLTIDEKIVKNQETVDTLKQLKDEAPEGFLKNTAELALALAVGTVTFIGFKKSSKMTREIIINDVMPKVKEASTYVKKEAEVIGNKAHEFMDAKGIKITEPEVIKTARTNAAEQITKAKNSMLARADKMGIKISPEAKAKIDKVTNHITKDNAIKTLETTGAGTAGIVATIETLEECDEERA